MSVPGSNLLNMALTVIAPQTVKLFKTTARAANAIGMQVSAYAAPVNVRGSFQPVPRNLYQQYGLDFNKNYATFYVSALIQDVTRATGGDQVEFGGRRYQVLSENDWIQVDGWTAPLLVDIGPEVIDAG